VSLGIAPDGVDRRSKMLDLARRLPIDRRPIVRRDAES
jgi:hypothetical protein